jgi:hypothetical protein
MNDPLVSVSLLIIPKIPIIAEFLSASKISKLLYTKVEVSQLRLTYVFVFRLSTPAIQLKNAREIRIMEYFNPPHSQSLSPARQ